MTGTFVIGADLSTLEEEEACGACYYDGGRAGDAMAILQAHGVNCVRLRLWNDPYDGAGAPYGAGTCDLARVMRLAARAKACGLPWLLDLHYSDFWADPGKQRIPKAWQGLAEEELCGAVYAFTAGTLQSLKEAGLAPDAVAVGNEITNGLLWPTGKRPNDAAMTRLINAGIRATRETAPQAAVMLHLDQGGNNAMYRGWFDSYFANGGADFDQIGLSYYPFWHGSLQQLADNMHDLAARYGKPMIVAETSMAFTYEPYALHGEDGEAVRKPLAANRTLGQNVPYPGTPEGQKAFLEDLAAVIRGVPDGLGRGLIWWEPAWVPVPGCGWANGPALAYIKEQGPGGNEWANQCLFDYNGNALPALYALEDLAKDK